MKNEPTKDAPRSVIQLVPTWTGILPILMEILKSDDMPKEAVEAASAELRKMAVAADLAVKLQDRMTNGV